MSSKRMTTPDPLDAVLAQAFGRALEELESPALTERVLERVKREQRLRMLVTVLVAGLAVVLVPVLLGPLIAPVITDVLADLAGALMLPELPAPALHTMLIVALMFLLAPWLYALVEDPF